MTGKTPPIISVVGRTDSGKTMFIVKLVAELKKRGYRVATIKHSGDRLDIDHPGKDTWRHARAGADTVLLVSGCRVAIFKKYRTEPGLDDIATSFLEDADIVITEGFKKEAKPKIEVVGKGAGADLLCSREELLAVVGETENDLDVPVFGADDAKGVAELLEKTYL